MALDRLKAERCSSTTNELESTLMKTGVSWPRVGSARAHQTVNQIPVAEPRSIRFDSCPLVFIRGFLLHSYG